MVKISTLSHTVPLLKFEILKQREKVLFIWLFQTQAYFAHCQSYQESETHKMKFQAF